MNGVGHFEVEDKLKFVECKFEHGLFGPVVNL